MGLEDAFMDDFLYCLAHTYETSPDNSLVNLCYCLSKSVCEETQQLLLFLEFYSKTAVFCVVVLLFYFCFVSLKCEKCFLY